MDNTNPSQKPASKSRRRLVAAGRVPKNLADRPRVTVCDACLCASCWLGVFMCERARSAGVVQKTVAELRALDREHPSYWSSSAHGGRHA